MVPSVCKRFERIWWPLRGLFLIFLIIFIIFQTYSIKNLQVQYGKTIKTKETDQQHKKEQISNENLLQNISFVIVVQVHNRPIYLKHLIESLHRAANISQVLLIFSHDHNDKDINELVQPIDFCHVLQIFYPYSLQNHEHEFPGQDPNDCPPDITPDEAINLNCKGALHPDRYGHYRHAKDVQAKHHWWWKANQVFSHLNVTRNYAGPVIFLEEDHYVAEDFLYMLNLMIQQSGQLCPKCKAFALGNHDSLDYYWNFKTNYVSVSPWQHNMGFTFNRSVWNEIVKCDKIFCTYDDYNWDWTLRFISQNCLPSVLLTMVAERTRIFHIGECGMHIKKKDCDPGAIIKLIRKLQEGATKLHQVYPKTLTTRTYLYDDFMPLKPNGGWGDSRDHQLCTSFSQNTEISPKDLDSIT